MDQTIRTTTGVASNINQKSVQSATTTLASPADRIVAAIIDGIVVTVLLLIPTICIYRLLYITKGYFIFRLRKFTIVTY